MTIPLHLLDTNHMSILERQSPESQRLEARMLALPQDDIGTTIISYEEQTRGVAGIFRTSASARDADSSISTT